MLQTPFSSTVLVGRDAELSALRERQRASTQGQGSTVLVSGEAGIGKSRLVAELSRGATHVVRGSCFEPDHSLPLAPVVDLLRRYFEREPPAGILARLGAGAAEIAGLMPELATGDPGFTSPVATEREKRRLFEALAGFFDRLTEAGPLLVIVEDLHWSDDTSLEFLLHLVRKLATLPVLLLLTYRSDEVQPSLAHLLAALDRERLAAELALHPLTSLEVDQMLRAMFDQPQPIRADFLHEIQTLTDGNPFFIEEVVGSLIAAGDIYRAGGGWERKSLADLSIPRTVQHAVTQRTGRLSPSAKQVLEVAAVAGQRFDFTVLLALTEHDEMTLLQLVRELIAAQLVTELSADQFAFRHALTRQAVYGELLSRERRTIHQSIGATIEGAYGDRITAYLPELAYHFYAAEAWEKTLQFAPEAGKRALDLYAPRAAIEHYTRALDAAAHLSVMPNPNLHRERGLAHATLGEFERAHADYEAALQLTRSTGDRLAEWEVLGDLGELWTGYDYARAGIYFEQALKLADDIGDREIQARSLVQLGNWQVNVEQVVEAERSLTAAVGIFEETGNQHGIAETLDLLGIVANTVGDAARGRDYMQRASALYRALDDRRGLASTLATYASSPSGAFYDGVVTPTGLAPAVALPLLEESLKISREIGWRSGEAYSQLSFSFYHERRGVFGRAFEAVDEGFRIAREIEHQEWLMLSHSTHGILCLHILDGQQARRSLTKAYELACQIGSLHFEHTLAGHLASACIACNDLDWAAAVVDAFDAELPIQNSGKRVVWLARAELALARGHADSALDILDRLFATALNLTDQGDIPHAAKLRGEALLALGRMDEAEMALHAALSGAKAREMQPLLWRLYLSLGHLLEATDRHSEAGEQFQSARELVQEIVETLPDGPLRDTFWSRASLMIPAALPRENELTSREREVALLVTQGMSNRDIAGALFIGERTVETHVTNILAKLGFRSRTQIAAWTIKTGLADAAS